MLLPMAQNPPLKLRIGRKQGTRRGDPSAKSAHDAGRTILPAMCEQRPTEAIRIGLSHSRPRTAKSASDRASNGCVVVRK